MAAYNKTEFPSCMVGYIIIHVSKISQTHENNENITRLSLVIHFGNFGVTPEHASIALYLIIALFTETLGRLSVMLGVD